MIRKLLIHTAYLMLSVSTFLFYSSIPLYAQTEEGVFAPGTMTREELEQRIQEQAKELESLQPKLETARQELQSTQKEKRSLQ